MQSTPTPAGKKYTAGAAFGTFVAMLMISKQIYLPAFKIRNRIRIVLYCIGANQCDIKNIKIVVRNDLVCVLCYIKLF